MYIGSIWRDAEVASYRASKNIIPLLSTKQITLEGLLNEVGKAARNLPGVTALRKGGVGTVRAG